MMSRLIAACALGGVVLLGRAEAATAQAATSPAHVSGHVHHARGHRRHASLARPGVAPLPAPSDTRVAGATAPAPVPNEAVSPPDPPAPQAQIAPSSFQLHYPPVGDGYVTGSSSQAMDDREAAKATGVQMTVPLQ